MRATAAGIGLWLAIAAGGAGIGVAPAMAQDTVVVATFNTEFLTRPKVHLKFGFPFNLSGIDAAQWAEPGFRDQQFSIAADSVAKVLAAIDAHAVLSKLPLSNVIPIIPGREHYYEELDDPEGENDPGSARECGCRLLPKARRFTCTWFTWRVNAAEMSRTSSGYHKPPSSVATISPRLGPGSTSSSRAI